jgi:hypothetical protein
MKPENQKIMVTASIAMIVCIGANLGANMGTATKYGTTMNKVHTLQNSKKLVLSHDDELSKLFCLIQLTAVSRFCQSHGQEIVDGRD